MSGAGWRAVSRRPGRRARRAAPAAWWACRRRSTRAWARSVGSVQAATFSFLVGTAVLLLISTFVHGGLGNLGNVGRAPWWALVGGLLGAVYVHGRAGRRAHARRQRPDGRRDHRPARDLGRDRPLRAARRRADSTIGAQRILGLVLLVAGVVLVRARRSASDARAALRKPSRQHAISRLPAELAPGEVVGGALAPSSCSPRRSCRRADARSAAPAPRSGRGAPSACGQRRQPLRHAARGRRRRCCRPPSRRRCERGDRRAGGVVDVDERPHAARRRRRSAAAAGRGLRPSSRPARRRCRVRRSSRSAATTPPAPSDRPLQLCDGARRAPERLGRVQVSSGSPSTWTVPGGPGA